jgi:hypothetical protein
MLKGKQEMRIAVAVSVATFLATVTISPAQPQGPDTLWTRVDTTNGTGILTVNGAIQTPDQGYVLIGAVGDSTRDDADILVWKKNQHGDPIWEHRYGGDADDVSCGLCATSDGGFVIVGYTDSWDHYSRDIYVLKLDSHGDTLWTRIYGGNGIDIANAVVETPQGDLLVVGDTDTYTYESTDGLLLHLNGQGDSLGQHLYGRGYLTREKFQSISAASNNRYLLAGTTSNFGFEVPDSLYGFILCVDGSFSLLWSHIYAYGDQTAFNAAAQTSDGNILFVGTTSAQEHPDFNYGLLGCTDSLGYLRWLRELGQVQSGDYTVLSHLLRSPDGSCIVGGVRSQFYEQQDMIVLARYNSSGDTVWSKDFPVPAEGFYYRAFALGALVKTRDGGYFLAGDLIALASDTSILHSHQYYVQTQPDPMPVGPRQPPFSGEFALMQNYPNPFNSSTHLEFRLPSTQRVSLRLYDVLGREVTVMVNEIRTAGQHEFMLDASGLPSGVYLCRLEAGGFSATRKLLLIR